MLRILSLQQIQVGFKSCDFCVLALENGRFQTGQSDGAMNRIVLIFAWLVLIVVYRLQFTSYNVILPLLSTCIARRPMWFGSVRDYRWASVILPINFFVRSPKKQFLREELSSSNSSTHRNRTLPTHKRKLEKAGYTGEECAKKCKPRYTSGWYTFRARLVQLPRLQLCMRSYCAVLYFTMRCMK
jgi:hypothetical protein